MTTAGAISMQDAAGELLARRSARRSLIDFTTYTKPDYELNWHNQLAASYLDRFVSGEIKRLMIFEPPRHGKSELVSRRLPAYIFGLKPNASIIACSYSADLAARMNRDVQRIMDSTEYLRVFPETRLNSSNIRTPGKGNFLRNSDIFEIVGRTGVYRSAGVGGGITGMGCTYGIIDDPIKNREEANSKTYREKVKEWYTSTFYTRLEKDAGLLVTLTRWHEDDLAGWLIEQTKAGGEQWVVLSLPAIAEGNLHPEDPREEGEPLWESKYNRARLASIRTVLGLYDWTALYQQKPSPKGGGILKIDWFNYIQELPPYTFKLQSWDTAFKDGEQNDYSVCSTWIKTYTGYALIDLWRGKVPFPELKRMVVSLYDRDKPNVVLIEDAASGQSLIQELKRTTLPVHPVKVDRDKIARVNAVSPTIEAGKVFLKEGAPWVADFLTECMQFPTGEHDDQVDTMTQALDYLRSGVTWTGDMAGQESQASKGDW